MVTGTCVMWKRPWWLMIGAGCSSVGELSSETGKAPESRGDGSARHHLGVLEVKDGTHQPAWWVPSPSELAGNRR